jgi:hypothetical protein
LSPVLRCGVVAFAAAFLASTTTACSLVAGGSSGSATGTVNPQAAPTATAGDDLGPADPLPESRPVRGPSFTLSAPAEFQQSQRPGPDDVPMLVLSKESTQPAGVIEVVAYDEVDPPTSLKDQSYALESLLTDVQGATDVTYQSVEWPGADEAVVLQWTKQSSAAGGSVVERWTQLGLASGGKRITTVIAVAPEQEFDSSGVLDVLRTLALDSA